jgi:hypothetical protein
MATARRYDLYSHEFRAAAHETYARMRSESPVHRQPGLDGETPIWFVTRAVVGSANRDASQFPGSFRSLASLPVAWDA